jgi:transcriptional regulator with XRE-family HTH domain
MATIQSQPEVGSLLRQWRERRRVTQLELALDAGISARHLSFVETGRSKPGREMLLRVLQQLEVRFPERSLDDPDLAPVREALDVIPLQSRTLSGGRGGPRLEPSRHLLRA